MKNPMKFKTENKSKLFLIFIGIASTAWFLFRVIPKPSRASYPCMRAAAPFMSTFFVYMLSLGATVFAVKKFKQNFAKSKYLLGSVFLLVAIFSFSLNLFLDNKDSIARSIVGIDATFPVISNTPVGEAHGLQLGRVVWMHHEDATNENFVPKDNGNDWWYDSENVNQSVVSQMLTASIVEYAGASNINSAWDAIFKNFNNTRGNGSVGYVAGEKIAIKINLTNQSNSAPNRMDATPQLVNSLLHELTVNAGVPQSDITLGDPYRNFRDEYIDIVMSEYPDVNYVDGNGGSGVEQTEPSDEEVLIFSDGQYKSTLPQHYIDAKYTINMPCLKTHNEGGITLIAKNHQGSFLELGDDPKSQYAINMHYSLPGNSSGQKKYRHTVDYMGHEDTGGKALIYIIDGIWGGESWEGWIKKFKSAPFNDDYPNSIFVGQDPIALESVCFDILFEEYVIDDDKDPYPIEYKAEIADYLLQCASSDYWPDDISYDPEGDGTDIGSLGVFEHWNNSTDRQYSRNLGTGEGIELKYTNSLVVGVDELTNNKVVITAPNPFMDYTIFSLPNNIAANSTLNISDISGRIVRQLSFEQSNEIRWNGDDEQGNKLSGGIYIYTISESNGKKLFSGKVNIN